jgi:hypothetical protein
LSTRPVGAQAQTSTSAFLPELDAYVRLNSDVRFFFQAEGGVETGNRGFVELGPGGQVYLADPSIFEAGIS